MASVRRVPVAMWESEVVTGQGLPTVCAVTGDPATGWLSCDVHLDPSSDDARTAGRLPAAARVVRADHAVSAYWLGSLLGWAYLVVGIVAGWPALMWVVLAVMGSWLLGATVLWPVLGRIHPHPVATLAGTVDGERWLHVTPVHPAFAAAVDHLPGPRPPAASLRPE